MMMSKTKLHHAVVSSPLGPLRLAADDDGLVEMLFAEQADAPTGDARAEGAGAHPVLMLAARELGDYFAGRLTRFTVPLAPRGTPFQMEVWRALVAIPFGERRTYRDITRAIGRQRGERAVGAANGKNRIGIIVPCHRVIGMDGSLTGYAGGLSRKKWLLEHEAGASTD